MKVAVDRSEQHNPQQFIMQGINSSVVSFITDAPKHLPGRLTRQEGAESKPFPLPAFWYEVMQTQRRRQEAKRAPHRKNAGLYNRSVPSMRCAFMGLHVYSGRHP